SAANKPPAKTLAPIGAAVFSSSSTLTSSSLAASAAAVPAAPAPTTTISYSNTSTFGGVSSVFLFNKASTSPPACLTQSSTALNMALLVKVAPLTTSTPMLCSSTIF